MNRIVFASVSILVVSLSALTGCGASSSASKASAVPSSAAAPAPMSANALMPGETEFSFDGNDKGSEPRSEQATSFRPNQQERPTHGAIHAAH